ncbi:MAG: carboxypeptidase regulatory-like domain-containing protein [Limisphaerales bacterium]
MKTFWIFPLLLALASAFNARAATNDAATFSGTVVDAQGNPVASATVDFYQYPTRQGIGQYDLEVKQHATTDSRGAFELLTFDGQGVAVVQKTGFAPGWRTWYAAPQDPPKIVLSAPSTLAGVVADNAGRPVPDADICVPAAVNKTLTDFGQPDFLYGKISRELFSTRTSADGTFHFDNFPADAQAILSVKKAGLALRPTTGQFRYDALPYHAGQTDITLTLDPAGSVSGKVVVRGTGQPLASVVVDLVPTSQTMAVLSFDQTTNVSAADGSFLIPDVPAGSYQVLAFFTNQPVADWVADPVPATVAVGQTLPDVQLQAYKGGVVEVTVVGSDHHQPLADASVSVYSGNGRDYNPGGLTGTNGKAYFRLSPGQFSVAANKPDWSQAQSQATATEGQTSQVTIEMPAPLSITGIVRDPSGAPVANASVGVFPDYGSRNLGAKTGSDGHYTLKWQKPAYVGMSQQSFYLIARQSQLKLAAIQEVDETTTNLEVTLQPAMSVSGQVQDPAGKPVTNAVAYVSIQQENSSFTLNRQIIHSDEQGRIEADALPKGERYGFYISAQGYGSPHEEMDAADPKADHYDFPPLTLKLANLKLAGRVLGTDGKPVAGANIFMNGDGQPNGNAITDADGRFTFDAVCDGELNVSANMNGMNGQTTAMGGDTNIVIRFNAGNVSYQMGPPQTVTGTVYDPSGNPDAGARVVVTPAFGQTDVAKTDAQGGYSVNWQPQPGMPNMKNFVIARDVERNLAAIEPIATGQTNIILRLVPGLSISGTVQDAKGTPLPRANINLNIMTGNNGGMVEYQPIKIDTDGTFTIPALPTGQQYLVFARASGYGSAQKNIGKTQSQTNSIQLSPFKLKTADLVLAGQVLGTDKKPLSGAQVQINGNGQPSSFMRTDATGHFKFKVCEGPIQIFAYSPSGGGRMNSGIVQAQGGDTAVVVRLGAQQQGRLTRSVRRDPLKPQAWTLAALVTWPADHKTGVIILLSLQAVVLLATAGGIFLFARKRG